jgi:hypothetical protein
MCLRWLLDSYFGGTMTTTSIDGFSILSSLHGDRNPIDIRICQGIIPSDCLPVYVLDRYTNVQLPFSGCIFERRFV